MQDRHLTLFIPALLGGGPDWHQSGLLQELAVDELELLLSRASQRRFPAEEFEACLFRLFGHPHRDKELPVAAVTHLVDMGSAVDCYCLRADPVHLVPDRDRIIMFGNQHLGISAAEATQLADEFNRLFAADGLQLETPVPERWYLKSSTPMQISTRPLASVIGKDIHRHLPSGEAALQWHRLLNEVQMLFYSSSVNERRRARGQAEINSLWFWGGGELPVPGPQPWQHIWSNETVSRGLALLSDSLATTLPGTAEEWLEQASAPGQHLVVMDILADIVRQGDAHRWRETLETLNEAWLMSLLEALRANSLSSIRILTDNAEFIITARGLKKWWKRRRSLRAMQQVI